MGGDNEWGECQCCGALGAVNRTYFKYGIKCLCHSTEHFQIVWHCDKCEPEDPGVGNIELSNEQKHKIEYI
jgi:hypothetical protein